MQAKPRVLIFVVAYEAEKTIGSVLRRIPPALCERYELECLVIDDSSRDDTFSASRAASDLPFPRTVLYNPVNQGYGGNQKIGYHYAIEKGFDFVALLHGEPKMRGETRRVLLGEVLFLSNRHCFGHQPPSCSMAARRAVSASRSQRCHVSVLPGACSPCMRRL